MYLSVTTSHKLYTDYVCPMTGKVPLIYDLSHMAVLDVSERLFKDNLYQLCIFNSELPWRYNKLLDRQAGKNTDISILKVPILKLSI